MKLSSSNMFLTNSSGWGPRAVFCFHFWCYDRVARHAVSDMISHLAASLSSTYVPHASVRIRKYEVIVYIRKSHFNRWLRLCLEHFGMFDFYFFDHDNDQVRRKDLWRCLMMFTLWSWNISARQQHSAVVKAKKLKHRQTAKQCEPCSHAVGAKTWFASAFSPLSFEAWHQPFTVTVTPTQCLDEILIPQVMEKALGKLDLTVPEPWNPLELWNCPQLWLYQPAVAWQVQRSFCMLAKPREIHRCFGERWNRHLNSRLSYEGYEGYDFSNDFSVRRLFASTVFHCCRGTTDIHRASRSAALRHFGCRFWWTFKYRGVDLWTHEHARARHQRQGRQWKLKSSQCLLVQVVYEVSLENIP